MALAGGSVLSSVVSAQNNGASSVTFTTDELTRFTTDLAKIEIKGERLPSFVQVFSDVEAPPKK